MTDTTYRPGQCNDGCHFARYELASFRIKLRKRWTVRDNHIGCNLTKSYPNRDRADGWLRSLEIMEQMERIHFRDHPWRADRDIPPDVRRPAPNLTDDERRAATRRMAEWGRGGR